MKKVRLYLMKYFLFPSFSLRGSGEGRRILSLSLSFVLIFSLLSALCGAQPLSGGTSAPCGTVLPGFSESPYFREQVMSFVYNPDIKVHINAPSAERFDAAKPVKLVLYALPNGNSTDWTIGKLPAQGDDWHYFIQHIGAQTRYLRQADTTCNWVTVYLEARQKSWGTWRKAGEGRDAKIVQTVEYLRSLFAPYRPQVVLSSHSGGGNFVFGFMDAQEELPAYVERIVFIDSNYNWDDKRYGHKLAAWLEASPGHSLFVACYDDANALYNGKPFVSRKGGTWHRTKLMRKYIRRHVRHLDWERAEDDSIVCHAADRHRVYFYARKNPERQIYHTILVERNGYIHSLLAGTPLESRGYRFMKTPAYRAYVQDSVCYPHPFPFPPRDEEAMTGSDFVRMAADMDAEARDSLAFRELTNGNVPQRLRRPFYLKDTLADAQGRRHEVVLCVLPDFLALGSDVDGLRLPLLPCTAQRVADHYGAVLPTRKLSDLIHRHATLKLVPRPMTPDSTMTTLPVFARHDSLVSAACPPLPPCGPFLMVGHKKDIAVTNRLHTEPGRLFIYGWHYPDGRAIQPLSAAHGIGYVDYSHGVRLIRDEVLIDGRLHSLRAALQDPVLYALFSDEAGPMERTGYGE